jgi:hypothetical protein
MKKKKLDIVEAELELLSQDKLKNQLTTDIKKTAFVEEIKNNIGKDLKNTINNPNRHNPKKLSLWEKIKKALGC